MVHHSGQTFYTVSVDAEESWESGLDQRYIVFKACSRDLKVLRLLQTVSPAGDQVCKHTTLLGDGRAVYIQIIPVGDNMVLESGGGNVYIAM